MAALVDEADCIVEAGNGGHGLIAFLREKFRPHGGPCGGDGGKGGDVVLVVDADMRTLLDFKHHPFFKAERGQHGQGRNRTGRSGQDREIRVPLGTEVEDLESGEILGDLTHIDDRLVVAAGGRGGRGNQHFATSKKQAPQRAQDGIQGERRRLKLTLKLMADVGLVGFPNAGKSTLLSVVSKARPKIADYPFTTLEPNLGLVPVGDYQSFVMADIPGLIEGAGRGKGLGLQFLRHIERTRVLLFLIEATDPDPEKTLGHLQQEVSSYSETMVRKPQLIVFSKADLLPPGKDVPGYSRLGEDAAIISAHTGQGIAALLTRLHGIVTQFEKQTEDL